MNKFGFSDILEYQVRISKRHLRISGVASKITQDSNPENLVLLEAYRWMKKWINKLVHHDYPLVHHDDNHAQQEAYRKAVQESRGALEEDEDDASKADNNKEQVSLISRY